MKSLQLDGKCGSAFAELKSSLGESKGQVAESSRFQLNPFTEGLLERWGIPSTGGEEAPLELSCQ